MSIVNDTSRFACIRCGKQIEKKPGKGRNPKFCSKQCRWRQPRPRPHCNTCIICGAQFNSTSKASKTCSKACNRILRTNQAERVNRPECLCEGCGKTFTPAHSLTPASKNAGRFCSRECCFASDWHRSRCRQRQAEHAEEQKKDRACLRCGKTYRVSAEWKNTRFCSEACRDKVFVCVCRFCGKDFQTRYPKVKYCSQACGLDYLDRSRPRKAGQFQCIECGRLATVAKHFSEGRTYCSIKCSKRATKRNARHVRRQRVNTGQPDMITIAKLMERDKGICYHCGNSVDATAKTPMSRAPTIDHFIPVSKKGLHKWDNVVLACFDCNVDKSDSMPSKDGQQLMFAV